MIELKDHELEKISGGAVPYIWIGIAVAAVIIFLSGVVDGVVHPKECS